MGEAGETRVVQRGAFQPWYAQLNLVVGCLLISAVLYAMGPNGHVLYGAYLIAPLQAALYLERREAWGALIINLVAFTLVTTGVGVGVTVGVGVAVAVVPASASTKERRSISWYVAPLGSWTSVGEPRSTLRLVLKLLQL